MALNWHFKEDFLGTCGAPGYDGEIITYNVYSGNCLAIILYETDETYQLHNFMADKDHAKRCIADGMYNDYHFWLDIENTEARKLAKFLIDNKIRVTCSITTGRYFNKGENEDA